MKKILALVLCLAALPAAAHGGHDATSGFSAGLAHPFTGLDHLLAMLGIGMLSRGQQRPLALPLTFVAMMALGAALQAGFAVAEQWIAASVLLTGMLLAAVRLPQRGALMVVALFALLHGLVHGHELPGVASGAGYLLASAGLLLTGMAMVTSRAAGVAMARSRAAGAAIAGAGLWMLV